MFILLDAAKLLLHQVLSPARMDRVCLTVTATKTRNILAPALHFLCSSDHHLNVQPRKEEEEDSRPGRRRRRSRKEAEAKKRRRGQQRLGKASGRGGRV